MRPAIFLTIAVVVYGNLVNLLPRELHEAVYVPLNVTAGVVFGLVVWRVFGLGLAEMGQDRRGILRGVVVGGGIGLAIVIPLYLALLVPGLREIIADDTRHAGLSTLEFLYTVLVRIPIGTALFEEWVFRGVLFGVWLKVGNLRAAFLVPSAAFGLWHIVPTIHLAETVRPDPSIALVVVFVGGAVVATFIVGVLFTLLRQDSRGILGPTLTHGVINSLAVVAAVLAR
ncbi:MAG: type II CAAX endopeptidase family protein [Dehalococcoidia bacterium]